MHELLVLAQEGFWKRGREGDQPFDHRREYFQGKVSKCPAAYKNSFPNKTKQKPHFTKDPGITAGKPFIDLVDRSQLTNGQLPCYRIRFCDFAKMINVSLELLKNGLDSVILSGERTLWP